MKRKRIKLEKEDLLQAIDSEYEMNRIKERLRKLKKQLMIR